MKGCIKMKKLISVMLASVMAMALMIPAFATSQTLTATGVTAAPTIKLTMPKAVNIALNPYRMSYKNSKIGLEEGKTDTFISPVVEIKNESDTALKMAVKGNATKAGAIKIVAADAVQTSTPGDKNVAVSVNILPNVAESLGSTAAFELTGDALKTAALTDKAADIFGGTGTDAVDPIELDACEAGSDGKLTPNYIRINFSGDCNTNPKDAYVTADTVGVSLTFTFTPVAATVETPAP